MRGRITRNALKYRRDRRQYWGGPPLENGKMAAIRNVMPAISAVQRVFKRTPAPNWIRRRYAVRVKKTRQPVRGVSSEPEPER